MAELEQVETVANPIGDRLKAAREAQGMQLDEIAAKTRVPIRHLVHIEKGEWDQLPAPTYSIGFARAYATAVGLNPAEIGTELRSQMNSAQTPIPAYYEPADPARVPPRWLAFVAAIVAIVVVAGYFVWRSEALNGSGDAVAEAPVATEAAAAPGPEQATTNVAQPAPATTGGPVVLTATDDVWLRVYQADGSKLFENTLKAGERFEVPATATTPQILTSRPNAIHVTVGSTEIPALGPPERKISNVSLLAADLLARGSTQAATPTPIPAPAQASAPPARAPRPAPKPPTTPTPAAEAPSAPSAPENPPPAPAQ